MDPFHKEQFEALAQVDGPTCVSIYMPTYPVEAQTEQNPIRLKNLLREARAQLKDYGISEPEAEALLAPAGDLLSSDNNAFWRQMREGLALFLTKERAEFYRVPVEFDELVVVDTRFHLSPLVPLANDDEAFYVLALSQNDVRLYRGTPSDFEEIRSAEIPHTIGEALFYDDDPADYELNPPVRFRDSGSGKSMPGQGYSAEDNQRRPNDRVVRFLYEVDRSVQEALQGEHAPLFLAGVRSYLPMYREVNSYQHLVEDRMIEGNMDHLSLKDLHAKAVDLLHELREDIPVRALQRFADQTGRRPELGSTDLKEVVPAAYFSRIDTLLVRARARQWGRFDADENRITLHDERQPGDVDLIDRTIMQVIFNGGRVLFLSPGDMPQGAMLAATFRFPAEVAAEEIA